MAVVETLLCNSKQAKIIYQALSFNLKICSWCNIQDLQLQQIKDKYPFKVTVKQTNRAPKLDSFYL